MKPDTSIAAAIQPSPNYGERNGRAPDAIILHYTGIATGEAALQRLCDAAAQVSAHYLVYEDGSVFQLVPEARRAWHAGIGYWAGERDMNSVSIGIEIANAGHAAGAPPYPSAQVEAVIALCQDIISRHTIRPQRVLGHSDLAPDRKIDPGEYFPWERLAKAGVGHYVAPCAIEDGARIERGAHGLEVERLQSMLAIYGYGLNVTGLYGSKTQAVVTAFQRHFRPALVDGIADVSTIETLRKVIAAQPKG